MRWEQAWWRRKNTMIGFVSDLPIVVRENRARICRQVVRRRLLNDAFQAAADSYFSDLAVLHRYIGVNAAIARYGHPTFMAVSAVLLGGAGVSAGFRSMKEGERSSSREFHGIMMITLFLIFLAGFGGGSLSNVMLERDLWSSAHSYSAIAVLALLTLQIPLAAFKAKSIHRKVGLTTVGIFGIHLLTGVQLLLQS